MDYRDQLILNGKINDVGEYTRQNVERSYRKGIELELAYLFSSSIRFEGNLSLSQNKIKDFMEYIDDYDSGLQNLRHFQSTDIAFSPSLIAYGLLSWNPVKALNIDFSGKYVGKQFLDNTESDSRSIDAYLINDLQFRYSPGLRSIKLVSLSFQINNVLDIKYSSNGYTYSYVYGGDLSTFNYYFPQAGRNFMAGINLRF
jgi:iron complex outermembrane receptor protein